MAVAGDGKPGLRVGPYVLQPNAEAGSPTGNAARGPAFGPDDDGDPFLGERPQPDSWDFDPEIELPNDAYRGIRRARGARPFIKVGVVVGIVVLVAAIALIIAMKSDHDAASQAGGDSPTLLPSFPGADQPTPSVTGIVDSGPAVASAPPVAIPAFEPLTFEAEAGPPSIKRRGADVETLAGASGGQVVRFVGASGELEIRGIDFTGAGTYRIAVYYASAAAGTAIISLPGAAPLTVSFAGGSGCCSATAVEVALSSGHQTMTISDVTSGVAIDRVVITRSAQ
jgi:hypothetical protein